MTYFPQISSFVRYCVKNIVEPDRPQMTIWHTRIACWITKTANTHSEYEILIRSPLQRLERVVRKLPVLLNYCPRRPFPINDLSQFGHIVLHKYIKSNVYHYTECGHCFMIYANVRNRRNVISYSLSVVHNNVVQS